MGTGFSQLIPPSFERDCQRLSSEVRSRHRRVPSFSATADGSIASWFQRVPLWIPPALWCGTFSRPDFFHVFPKSSVIKKIAPNPKSLDFCELEVRRVMGIRMRFPTTRGSVLNESGHGHICDFFTHFPSLPQSRNHAEPPMFRKLKYLPLSGWKNGPNSSPLPAWLFSHVNPPSEDSMYILLETLFEYIPPTAFSGCPP